MTPPQPIAVPREHWMTIALRNFFAFWSQPWVWKSLSRAAAIAAAIGVLIAVLVNLFWALHMPGLSQPYRLDAFKAALMLFPASMIYPGVVRTINASGMHNWGAGLIGLCLLNGPIYAVIGAILWMTKHRHKLYFLLALYLVIELWRGVSMLH